MYSYEHYTIPDNFIIRYDGQNLLQTGFVGGSGTGKINVPKGNSTTAEVIVATNDEGTAWYYSVTAETCPDTTPFNIELAGGDFTDTTDASGETVCHGSGTIYLGRTDGIARMLRIEGSVEFNKTSAKFNGTVYSLIGAGEVLSKPLFTGQFEIPFSTGTATSFSETPQAGEYQLGGMDVSFSSISVNRDSVSLGASFKLLEEFGAPDALFSGPDGLIITQNDVRIGHSLKYSLPTLNNFNLFNFVPIKELSGVAIEFIAPEDTLKLQGKMVVDMKGKFTISDITADLSGPNFIQFKGGKVDLKGVLTVGTKLESPGGWKFKEARIAIDTIAKQISVSAKIQFPNELEVDGTLGFKLPIPPLELNEVTIDIDNANLLVPETPGIYFQGVKGSVKNFAASEVQPIEFSGDIKGTVGPQEELPEIDIDELGIHIGGGKVALLRMVLGATITPEQLTGTGTITLLHDRIAQDVGTTTINWKDKYFQETGTFTLLDGLITTGDSFKVGNLEQPRVTMGGTATVGIPKFMFGGATLGSGNYLLDLSADGNYSNDVIAGWGTVSVPFVGLNFVVGFKVALDGSFERIGTKNIPKIGSWDLTGYDHALIIAEWPNDATGPVPVHVRKPDGTWIEEADFAANGIYIVDDLTTANSKVVLIEDPTPGIWEMKLLDETGLGTVEYSAATPTAAPTISLTSPATDVPGGSVAIDYTAADPDSDCRSPALLG